jgi:hypothetical protein
MGCWGGKGLSEDRICAIAAGFTDRPWNIGGASRNRIQH